MIKKICTKCNNEAEIFSCSKEGATKLNITYICRNCCETKTEQTYLWINKDTDTNIIPIKSTNKTFIYDVLKDSALFGSILILITVFWQILEMIVYNNIQPRGIDTIIALILAISLYQNIKRRKQSYNIKS